MPILRGKKRQKLVKEYFEAKKRYEELQEEISELKEILEPGLFDCDDLSVCISESKRKFFSQDKAKKFLTKTQLKKCYTMGKSTRRIRIELKSEVV